MKPYCEVLPNHLLVGLGLVLVNGIRMKWNWNQKQIDSSWLPSLLFFFFFGGYNTYTHTWPSFFQSQMCFQLQYWFNMAVRVSIMTVLLSVIRIFRVRSPLRTSTQTDTSVLLCFRSTGCDWRVFAAVQAQDSCRPALYCSCFCHVINKPDGLRLVSPHLSAASPRRPSTHL